jgi:hypothetical protein
MNWDDPSARLRLLESVGAEEYNRQMALHIADRGAIYPVASRWGTLYAVNGTDKAFSTRAQAEEYLATLPKGSA